MAIMIKRFAFIVLTMLVIGCIEPSLTEMVLHAKGKAGEHTPILINTEGNLYGYYEYLPKDFDSESGKWPLIFYWNGSNAISGNGKEDIDNLLSQGLPQYIHQGRHYPAIVISGMLPDWKQNDIHDFVEYIFLRYADHIDTSKVYMTGFSAGGGVTIEYISHYPEKFAAVIPIAPATNGPRNRKLNSDLINVSSWFFHNSGDMKVEVWRSNQWHAALKKLGGERRITRPDLDSHYSWQAAYDSPETWEWLFSQTRKPQLAHE